MQECRSWKLFKEDLPSCSMVMKTSIGVVYLLACLLEPFMPTFSNKVSNMQFLLFHELTFWSRQLIFSICFLQVLEQLSLPNQLSLFNEKGDLEKAKRPWKIIHDGLRIGKPVPLFKELVLYIATYLLSFVDYMRHIVRIMHQTYCCCTCAICFERRMMKRMISYGQSMLAVKLIVLNELRQKPKRMKWLM